MLDYNIIEEALREHQDPEQSERKSSKTAKEQLFESLLHEMYPMAYTEPKRTKYTRMSDLIRLLQDALWKIQDECRYSETNPEDKDIYDTIKQTYESTVNSILSRLQEVWEGPEEQESEKESEKESEQDSKQNTDDVDFNQIAIQLQPEEIVVSPQNKKYKIVEVSGEKTKLKELDGNEAWFAETVDVKNWKNRR